VCAFVRGFDLPRLAERSAFVQAINLRGHNEIAFGQAIDFVRPQGDARLTPSQQNVGMMTLFFGDGADSIHEIQSLLEVWEPELAMNMVFVGDCPIRNTSAKLF
jgi:hypothetical protein